MKILISNDDGVYAPGIQQLAIHLGQIAEVTVVAPDRDRSGASNSLTLDRPIRVRQLENGFYLVEGTPTDCVHLATTGLLNQKFDLVIAGINNGANLGDDVFYSGTVAAAMEGSFMGLPSLAVSLVGGVEKYHYATAARVAEQIIAQLIRDPLPPQTMLNVNVPDLPYDQLQGFAVTRMGRRHPAANTVPTKDPRGLPIYWIGPPGEQADAGPGTDFYALQQNQVAMSPVLLNLTHEACLKQMDHWVDQIKEVSR